MPTCKEWQALTVVFYFSFLLNKTKIPSTKINLIIPLKYSPDSNISIPVTKIGILKSIKNSCFAFLFKEALLYSIQLTTRR